MIYPGSPLIVDVLKRLAVEKTVQAQSGNGRSLAAVASRISIAKIFPCGPIRTASTQLAADA
jgi:hypothetical protein